MTMSHACGTNTPGAVDVTTRPPSPLMAVARRKWGRRQGLVSTFPLSEHGYIVAGGRTPQGLARSAQMFVIGAVADKLVTVGWGYLLLKSTVTTVWPGENTRPG